MQTWDGNRETRRFNLPFLKTSVGILIDCYGNRLVRGKQFLLARFLLSDLHHTVVVHPVEERELVYFLTTLTLTCRES